MLGAAEDNPFRRKKLDLRKKSSRMVKGDAHAEAEWFERRKIIHQEGTVRFEQRCRIREVMHDAEKIMSSID